VPTNSPPAARRDDTREVIHGVEVHDPYRWLEDGASAETNAWLADQREYAGKFLAGSERDRIRQRLAEIIRTDEMSVPVTRNGQYFYVRRLAREQQGLICCRKKQELGEEILIDPHDLSADGLMSVEILDVSPDCKLLAYAVRRGGEDEHEIRLRDLTTGHDLPDSLPKGRYYGNFSWNRDSASFYYFALTDTKACVRIHRIGTDPKMDDDIFTEGPGRGLFVYVSEDGRYLIVTVILGGGGSITRIYFQNLLRDGALRPLVTDLEGVFIPVYVDGGLVLRTNWQAPNWRLLGVDLDDPRREKWREILPEKDSPIQGLAAIGGKLVVTYLENVASKIEVYDCEGRYVRNVVLPGPGTAGSLIGRWDSAEGFFSFSSFDSPATILRWEASSGIAGEWWRQRAPLDFGRFEFKQVRCTSKDGIQIPIYVFHECGLELNQRQPTLLVGYGGFNESYTPFYWPQAVAWVERGGVFAVANLRGGGEFGESWHRAGMLEKKQNVFDDFIAAAEWLIANRYTNSERLTAIGASNGGLLVGATLTQRPDLFRAIVCWAPLLDMIRYQRHPLGPFWIPEFGSSDDPAQFGYLYAYSPYHNVRKGVRYPAVMFMTGEADSRCDPMHARKMTAALQWATASAERPILLHHRISAGHVAALSNDERIDEPADQLSFLVHEVEGSDATHGI
jgi:prolyl oligopeptidase